MKTPYVMIVILFGTLLLGGMISASKDNSWGILFNAPPREVLLGTAVAPYQNGDFIVAGTEVLYRTGSQIVLCSPANLSERVWVSEVTPEGQTAWLNVYNVSGGVSDVAITPNGSIVVVGNFGSSNSSVWVMKLNGGGRVLWARKYSVEGYVNASSVAVESDGSIILVGRAWVKASLGSGLWVMKLKSNGDVEWSRVYDERGSDGGYAVAVDANGNIVVAGTTDSFGSGYEDVWVLKLRGNGTVVWQKVYGGSSNDEARGVALEKNGDIVVVGRTWSFGANITDGWILRLTPKGNVEWEKAYGGNGYNAFRSVATAPNGYVYVVGYVKNLSGEEYAWLLKLDPDGRTAWQGLFGNGSDVANDVAVDQGAVAVVGTSFDMGMGTDSAFLLAQGMSSKGPYFRKTALPSRSTLAEVYDSNASIISLTPFDITSTNISVQGVGYHITVTPVHKALPLGSPHKPQNTTTTTNRSVCGPASIVALILLPLLFGRLKNQKTKEEGP